MEGASGGQMLQSSIQCNLQGFKGCSRLFSEYPQRWRPHNLSGQLVPAFDHPHSVNLFLVLTETPLAGTSSVASSPVTQLLQEKSVSVFSVPSHYLKTRSFPMSSLNAKSTQLFQLVFLHYVLLLPNNLGSLLLDLIHYASISSILGSTKLDTV